MARIKHLNEHFYHVYNRGVEKRIVFLDTADHARFLHLLFVCNDAYLKMKNTTRILVHNEQGETLLIDKRSDARLVDILCYSLMPNHFHLMLKQVADNGISLFMQRIGTAYTMYFNKKYERNGVLFQGSFKTRFVQNEQYLVYLSKYIHLNPVELIEPQWQENGIGNWAATNKFLEDYKWSSYADYIGVKNFPSIINRNYLKEYFKTEKEYKKFINEFLVADLQHIIL